MNRVIIAFSTPRSRNWVERVISCDSCLPRLARTGVTVQGTYAGYAGTCGLCGTVELPLARGWFVSPDRCIPRSPVPGEYATDGYCGPDPWEFRQWRGPFTRCGEAAAEAARWRTQEGKRSPLYLVLVEKGEATHCNLFDESRA